MRTFSLALRNLLRNRRRSLTTLLSMTIGLVAILIFGGYSSNTSYGMETGFVQGYGHLQIQRKGYFSDGGDSPIDYGIADYQRIIDVVKHDPLLAPMLTVVTPQLQLGGIAGNVAAGASRSVMAYGSVVEEFNQLAAWNDYDMVSYAHPLPLLKTSPESVVIGTGVARKLKLCDELNIPNCGRTQGAPASNGEQVPDDVAMLSALEKSTPHPNDERRIEMLAATAHGAPNVASLKVVKAENMGIKALDDVYLGMHLAQAQKLIYGSAPPQVTAILVQLKHTSQMPVAKERLSQLLATQFKNDPLTILEFSDLNPMYVQTIQFMDSIFGFISVLIGVIVLFTIGNTMSTAVVERTVEIGTLRAIGLRRSGILRLFLCEGVVLGVVGAVIGLVCALLIAYLINHSGMSWTPPGYVYPYLILIRVWQDLPLLVGSVIGLILVTVFSAWWPANRASRLMIVDALRHV
jgi:putative ABC transport system permease protein